ncbi:MAG TPA: GAF domain-containing protein [Pyrinomonadaceae bacterium]|nr:GAF domain-containing protein [Pyrinomonadaceae bacterium]
MSEQVPDTENERSRSAGTTKSFAAQVSEVVNRIDVANSLTVPLRRAIDDLLQLAATSVGAAVASVLVRHGDDGGLKFLTATSGVSEELLALRLPPGAGIAGLVFSTTQPMAVADVSNEGSFWSEADERTGFKTITLLATPLRANGEMVGVLEFVNRPGDPPYPPFTPAEMDRGSRFADAIARLVDAFEIAQLVESLFDYSIKASMSSTAPADLENDLREWIEHSQAAAEHRDLMLLWVSLREIIARGGAEREFCRDLLQMIARFMKARSGAGGNFGF